MLQYLIIIVPEFYFPSYCGLPFFPYYVLHNYIKYGHTDI